MSLKHAAQHLAAHGRGPDTTLVHMSSDEVKSLNNLAMAHGGHLSINPHTGLPEAGFLSSLLPMLAGGALTVMSGGVINPLTAGLLIGGGTAAVTGDIKKGLMAGLGAYGGAGIGSGLAASGTSALESQAANAVTQTPDYLAQQQLAQQQAAQLAQQQAASPAATDLFAGAKAPLSAADYATQAEKITQPLRDMTTAASDTARAGSGFGGEAYSASSGSVGNQLNTVGQGVKSLGQPGGFNNFYSNLASDPNTYGPKTTLAAAALPTAYSMYEDSKPKPLAPTPVDSDPGQQYDYMANPTTPTPTAGLSGQENKYFNPQYVKRSTPRFADGGITGSGNLDLHIPLDLGGGGGGGSYGGGGTYPFQSSGGFAGNNNDPQVAQQAQAQFNSDQAKRMQPYQTSPPQGLGAPQGNLFSGVMAEPQGKLADSTMSDTFQGTGAFGGNPQQSISQLSGLLGRQKMAGGGMASGGISDAAYNLGGYSDGGRLLRGPGDGVSDSIPATIGHKQPARLADGEFVVPARIVSELGNGSTEAGARKLYAMMDRVQSARSKTVGKGKIAKNSRADRHLPA